MTEPKQPKPGIPPLRMPEGLQSKYSNMARISHTPSEMIFDFATMLPGTHPEVVARILMSPMGAKMFLQALTENVARYEANFGLICLINSDTPYLPKSITFKRDRKSVV